MKITQNVKMVVYNYADHTTKLQEHALQGETYETLIDLLDDIPLMRQHALITVNGQASIMYGKFGGLVLMGPHVDMGGKLEQLRLWGRIFPVHPEDYAAVINEAIEKWIDKELVTLQCAKTLKDHLLGV